MDYFTGIDATIEHALAEDIGTGDITAMLIDDTHQSSARIFTRENAVICGRAWVDKVFAQVDSHTEVIWHTEEGEQVTADTELFHVRGTTRSLLTAERTALNFLQTLCATATETNRLVRLIQHTNTRLLDTRKTLPGLRLAQKYAVHTGGGMNHRIGLYDAFLIKENHIAASGSIAGAIRRARTLFPEKRVEVEVESLEQFRIALDAEPDWIMLDNFDLDDVKAAVAQTNRAIKLEVSGGLENDRDFIKIAETGVDFISVGALTKHCRAIDLSMLLD